MMVLTSNQEYDANGFATAEQEGSGITTVSNMWLAWYQHGLPGPETLTNTLEWTKSVHRESCCDVALYMLLIVHSFAIVVVWSSSKHFVKVNTLLESVDACNHYWTADSFICVNGHGRVDTPTQKESPSRPEDASIHPEEATDEAPIDGNQEDFWRSAC